MNDSRADLTGVMGGHQAACGGVTLGPSFGAPALAPSLSTLLPLPGLGEVA